MCVRSDSMEPGNIGKILITMGLFLVVIGAIILIGGRFGLGKLPGDVHIQKGNFTFYFPIVTCILISLGFYLISWIIRIFTK